jgi:hypothetical protein
MSWRLGRKPLPLTGHCPKRSPLPTLEPDPGAFGLLATLTLSWWKAEGNGEQRPERRLWSAWK